MSALCQEATRHQPFFSASGLATSRAQSMKSCATGVDMRFFNVKMPIGAPVTGKSTANFLMNGCGPGSCSQNSGMIVR
jgi:hypothetical protein